MPFRAVGFSVSQGSDCECFLWQGVCVFIGAVGFSLHAATESTRIHAALL